MKYGDRTNGTVERLDEKGRGSWDGFVVPFATIGDEVSATFVKRDKGKKVLRLEEVLHPGPDRVSTPCPHAGVCGGCLWQHISYDAQLILKRDAVNAAFESAGIETRIQNVTPCDKVLYYRNRMDYCVGWDGKVGLKEYGSWNRYLDLSTCMLLDKETAQILAIVRDLMRELKLEPWDARSQSGLLRYVVIRLGKNTSERLVMLVVSDLKKIDEESRDIIREVLSPLCTSLLLGEQPLITDISFVKTTLPLHGNPWLEEEVNGTIYRIAPNSFFQTNTGMAAKLQDAVLHYLSDIQHSTFNIPHSILDLYCGLGFFGVALAKQNPNVRVMGYELDAEAIELAKHNAAVNGVADRCTFESGPAEDLSWKDEKTDAVIIDPPRSGLHPRVIKTLLEMKPKRIVYVSCNFRKFVQELRDFLPFYNLESTQALDLFPQTPHVEVVSMLKLKD
ncbi:MAG: 23S rRNA (uracil(1939)-C(5))-methyltransferase RlmD [Patescibacteria group bacterium]